MLIFEDEKTTKENFGVEYFNVNETASLICRCMVCDGELDVEFEKGYVSLFEPEEEIILKDHIKDFADKLVKAIDSNKLKAGVIRRDFDENIIREETYINFDHTLDWLTERGVELGDLYYDDYRNFICDILSNTENFIKAEKARKRNPALAKKAQTYSEDDTLLLLQENLELKLRIDELEGIKNVKPPLKEKKLNPKRRDSLNKLVLAMAIKKYGYNPIANKNDSTANIENTLLKCGFTIDKNTIRTCLKEAYEDLSSELCEN